MDKLKREYKSAIVTSLPHQQTEKLDKKKNLSKNIDNLNTINLDLNDIYRTLQPTIENTIIFSYNMSTKVDYIHGHKINLNKKD